MVVVEVEALLAVVRLENLVVLAVEEVLPMLAVRGQLDKDLLVIVLQVLELEVVVELVLLLHLVRVELGSHQTLLVLLYFMLAAVVAEIIQLLELVELVEVVTAHQATLPQEL
jgi:hypothetical protein